MVESTEYSTFLESRLGNWILDVYIGKAVCNEKMQARFGEGFFSYFSKEIIYSIRLVPGSSPGQPIIIWKEYGKKKEKKEF